MKKFIFHIVINLIIVYLVAQYCRNDNFRYELMLARHNIGLPFIEKIHIPENAKYYAKESNLNNQGLVLETETSYYIVDDHLLVYEMDKHFNRILPFELTSPSTGIDSLQILGDWLFYTDKHISRVKLDGSGEEHLFSGWTSDLYVTPNWIYFVNIKDHSRLTRMTVNGEELKSINDVYICDLMFDDNGFIACIRSEEKKEDMDDYIYDVVTMDISGNITSTLMADTYASSIIKQEDLLYFRSNDSFIYTYDLKTKSKTLLIDRPMSNFAIDKEYIFYTGRDLTTRHNEPIGLFRYDLKTKKTKIIDEEIVMLNGSIQLLGDYVITESDYKKGPFEMIRSDRNGENPVEMGHFLED
jgi:hypothetical protein